MSGFFDLLAVMPAALVMCLVLTGVHGYLGLHVLRRKVIFVDLALAQIAALGGITAMALGFDPEHAEAAPHTLRIFAMLGWKIPAPSDEAMVYAFSLLFALAGAAVFATSRMRDERVPQEAFIGITFATAIAVALLLLVRVGGGAEQIRNMLAGDALLLSTWPDVAKTGALYGAIALLHVFFRDRFLLISEDPDAAHARGMAVRWWDFLFYASFALVITESVQIAGVLLVFSYLVVPGAIGVLFARTLRRQIALAWATGFGVSVVGLLLCAVDNLEPPGSSPGPWIVACLAATLAVVAIGRALARSRARSRFVLRLTLGAAAAGVLLLVGPLLAKEEMDAGEAPADPVLEALAGSPAAQLRALEEIARRPEPRYGDALLRLLESDPQPQVLEPALELAARFPKSAEVIARRAKDAWDPSLKIAAARTLAKLHDPRALSLLLDALSSEDLAPFDAEEAASLATELSGRSVDPETEGSLEAFSSWLDANAQDLSWDEAAGRFVAPSSGG